MGTAKDLVQNALRKLGYQVVRYGRPTAFDNNFSALAGAYEHQLALSRYPQLAPDPIRKKLMQRLLGTPPSQAYEIVGLLSSGAGLPGDICEFGVAQGETSALIANEVKSTNRMLHLFDSFEGLPAPSEKDQLKDDIFALGSMEAYEGKMACSEGLVQARLADIGFADSQYRIHKGFIENLIQERTGFPVQVCFAYVDFDFYEPILIALRYLDEVLVPGGAIMVDDYDFFSSGAKTAVTEFLEQANAESERYTIEVADQALGHFALLTRTDNSAPG